MAVNIQAAVAGDKRGDKARITDKFIQIIQLNLRVIIPSGKNPPRLAGRPKI
jgi:hypothetical protein